MKILWKLWLWFSKMFHQRVLSDWKWSISKFQFWRRILDIYRQPLLKIKTLFKWGLKLLLKYKIVIKAFANQRHHQGWENIPRGAIFIFKNRCNLLVCAEIKRFYLHSSLKKNSYILGCIFALFISFTTAFSCNFPPVFTYVQFWRTHAK